MKLAEIAQRLGLRDLTPETAGAADAEVSRAYASDLLSDVLANAPGGGLLVTVQVHMNVVAVAVHAGAAAVVFANGRVPDEAVRQKAAEENLKLFTTRETAFDVAGRLYELGVRGGRA